MTCSCQCFTSLPFTASSVLSCTLREAEEIEYMQRVPGLRVSGSYHCFLKMKWFSFTKQSHLADTKMVIVRSSVI